MDANAIFQVSTALQRFLAPVVGRVYVGPLDDEDAKGADLVLFLYRVAVNADLRNDRHDIVGPDGVLVRRSGALPLNLHYLLTAVTSGGGAEVDLNALRVLGAAMQVLNDTPNLVGIPVQGETVRMTLDPITSEEMSRIWTLFPTANYRTSVVYIASPVWIDPAVPTPDAAFVTEHKSLVGNRV